MRVKDIMTCKVETISPNDSVVFANELMWRKRIHHLIVTDGEKIVGILSDTDLGGPEADTIPDNVLVRQKMSGKVVTVDAGESLDKARNLMQGHQISSLPVTYNGKLSGIITKTDLENLEKRGITEVIYRGREPHQGPDSSHEVREEHGKSKTHHTEWPTRA